MRRRFPDFSRGSALQRVLALARSQRARENKAAAPDQAKASAPIIREFPTRNVCEKALCPPKAEVVSSNLAGSATDTAVCPIFTAFWAMRSL